MAKRHVQKQREQPRPRRWHEWMSEARREAEKGSASHGRAIVRVEKPRETPQRYTRAAWRKMTLAERVDVLAERLGVLEGRVKSKENVTEAE